MILFETAFQNRVGQFIGSTQHTDLATCIEDVEAALDEGCPNAQVYRVVNGHCTKIRSFVFDSGVVPVLRNMGGDFDPIKELEKMQLSLDDKS